MAVSFKESSSSGNFASQTTTAIAKPTNLAVGDLMIAHITTDQSTASLTAPTGFILLSGLPTAYNTVTNRVYWKIADTTDITKSTFDWTHGTANTAGRISTFTGHDILQPIVAQKSETVTIATPSGNWSINNDITPVADCVLAMFITFAELSATNGNYSIETDNPASWTEIYDHSTTLGVNMSQSACYSSTRSQTSSTGNSQGTSGTATAKGVICRMIAIQPERNRSATILNFSGFEVGANDNADVNSNSNVTFDTSVKRTGNYSGKVNVTSGTGVGYFQLYELGVQGAATTTNKNELYSQFYFRYSTKPSADYEQIASLVVSGNQLDLVLNSSGKLSTIKSTGIISTGSTTLSADTWYRIRIAYFNTGESYGSYLIYVDDTLNISGNDGSFGVTCSSLRLGKADDINGENVTYYFDDAIISTGNFVDEEASVLCIKPNANGTTMTWNAGTGASDYTQVNEIPPSESEYVMSPTSGNPNTARFNMQSCADVSLYGTILALKGLTYTREDTSVTSSTSRVSILSGATASNTGVVNSATTSVPAGKLLQTDPDTSVAWTIAGIDAVQIGAIENNAVAVRCASVLGMVLYIPEEPPLSTGDFFHFF